MRPNFTQISPILARMRTSLAVAGLVIVVIYGIYHEILGLNIFSHLGEQPTFQLINSIVSKLFWVALLAVFLGSLSYIVGNVLQRRASKRRSKVSLVDASLDERDSNYRATVNEHTGEVDISPLSRKAKKGGSHD